MSDKSSSSTPRTDACIAEFREGCLDFAWKLTDLTRQLERELAEARATIQRLATAEVIEIDVDGKVHYPSARPSVAPMGWRLVPEEPTAEMMRVGFERGAAGEYNEGIYKAMLAVAPSHARQPGEDRSVDGGTKKRER